MKPALILAIVLAVGCDPASHGQDARPGPTGGGGSAGEGGSGGAGAGGGGQVDGGRDVADGDAPRALLDQGRDQWTAAKAGCASYRYDRVYRLPLLGWNSATTVRISGDAPSRRSYVKTSSFGPDGGIAVISEWDETGDQIGSHTGVDVAPASTAEQILSECAELLSNPATTLQLGAHGVPAICSPYAGGDALTVGIIIPTFTCGP